MNVITETPASEGLQSGAMAPALPAAPAGEGWAIGVVPWPVYLVLVAVLAAFTVVGKVPGDISVMIAALAVGGFACAELGKRLPGLSQLGMAAIFATFVPSYLSYSGLLPKLWVKAITTFTKDSQILYLYIAAIIVGSVLSMDREVLLRGFLRIFVPMAAATLAAVAVGLGVGMACGLSAHDVFFFVLVPALGGGVGEGAIPLSIGYAGLMHQEQGLLLARILPAVMFASLTAIVFSGLISAYARSHPELTGNGTLQVDEHDEIGLLNARPEEAVTPAGIAGAGATAIALYLVGLLGQSLLGFPGPITMLILAILLNLGRVVTARLKAG
ncbi:MAG TPA: 2-hydroxycarboxylate transporter family protein, partial [Novosphingobium sp.]|nr:2-hydroxycarboxylate transporter family protein [Novosphingobium sp.]